MAVPGDLFFQLLFSPPTAAPDLGCSWCPGECWHPASSWPRSHFVQAGTGTVWAHGGVSPQGAPPSLGAAAWCWEEYSAGPLLAWGPRPFLRQDLLSSWSSSALTTYSGLVRWGWEGFHSSCIMYPS